MPNFTPYQTEQFNSFAPAALTAERLYAIAPAACAMNCRRAMALAVKWMYAVDKQLVLPYKQDLAVLLSTAEFVDLVDDKNLLRRLDFLRRLGNTAAHSAKKSPGTRPAWLWRICFIFWILFPTATTLTISLTTLIPPCCRNWRTR